MARRVAGPPLDPEHRGRLLGLVPPARCEVVGRHIAPKPEVARGFPLPRETKGFAASAADRPSPSPA
jgi:hypothetical protein